MQRPEFNPVSSGKKEKEIEEDNRRKDLPCS
jgi:hypothetical protein